MDENEVLRPVAQAMRAGHGTVLVGAGLSMQSGLSSWLGVLAPVLRADLGIELTDGDDLAELAQFYQDSVPGGRERLIAAVAADVSRVAVPSAVHEALASLPIAECWTTNFDSLLEASLPGHLVVEADAEVTRAVRQASPILVKMHGSLPTPHPTPEQVRRVVLTRDDFDTYPAAHPRLWSRVAASYLSGSMLFLGLSLSDPNMRVLQRLARTAHESGVEATSVVVMKRPSDPQAALRFEPRVADLARSGVRVLPIGSHDQLVDVLQRLRASLRPPRVILSGSTTSLDPETRRRAIRAAEALGACLADHSLRVVYGGSDLGAAVARRVAEAGSVLHPYDPTTVTAVRRRILARDTYVGYPPGPGSIGMPRDGTVRFFGSTPQDMRAELARLGCVVALLGGGVGTREEAQTFRNHGLTVVPWPATRGTAAELVDELEDALAMFPEPQRGQLKSALWSEDLELGAIAMVSILEAIQLPYSDTGPISSADPLAR